MYSNTFSTVVLLGSLTGFLPAIGTPLAGTTGLVLGWARFAKLFVTHPPMEERIARLLGAATPSRVAA